MSDLAQTWLHPIYDEDSSWMKSAALECVSNGHFHAIPNRTRTGPYMLRCWLSVPVAKASDGCAWDSGDSVLLHRFYAPDDDNALHDHPWDFSTRVLRGGYREFYTTWGRLQPHERGPIYGACERTLAAGQGFDHCAEDLHAVGALLSSGPTWTLVTTGQRRREWGFHPTGEAWVPWRKFLGIEVPA